MHKSFENKILVPNKNLENVDDELHNTIVNVPIVTEKSAKRLSTLIEPMNKVMLRDKLMPIEHQSPISELDRNLYVSSYKRAAKFYPSKYGSTNNKPKVKSEFEYRQEIIERDSRICELEMKLNSMQKENTDLRLSLNYFMQLQFYK